MSDKLRYILTALDNFLNDAALVPELVPFKVTSDVNPWSDPRGTPWMTYFWRDGLITHDTNMTARLDIMIKHSAEDEDGPMNTLTSIMEALITGLFEADNQGILAVDVNSKPIRVSEIKPLTFSLTPTETDVGWVHVGIVQCTIKFVR